MEDRARLLQSGKAKLAEFRQQRAKPQHKAVTIGSPLRRGVKQASAKTPIPAPETPCPIPSSTLCSRECENATLFSTPLSSFAAATSGEAGAVLLGIAAYPNQMGETPDALKVTAKESPALQLRAKFGSLHHFKLGSVDEHHSWENERGGSFLYDVVESAVRTPLPMLMRPGSSLDVASLSPSVSAIVLPVEAASKELPSSSSVVSLDEVLKLKQKVEGLLKVAPTVETHKSLHVVNGAQSDTTPSSLHSPVGGSPPQSLEAGNLTNIISAYATYSQKLFSLLCAQISHTESMKSAELEMQAAEWSTQKRAEQDMLAEAGEVVSELNAEKLRNQELQASVDALKWELLALRNEYAAHTIKNDTEHARVQAQAATNANAVASTMTELEEAKAQLQVMAAEVARRQAEHDFETSQIHQLQQALQSSNMEAQSSKHGNEQLELAIAHLRTDLQIARAECKEKEMVMQELARRAESCTVEVESSQATVYDLRERLDSVTRQYDVEASLTADLRQNVQMQRKELRDLADELASNQKSLHAIAYEREKEISALNTELEKLRCQFDSHQTEMATFRLLTEKHKAAEGQLISLREERDDLQDKLIAATAFSSTAQVELENLLEQNLTLQRERDEARSLNDHVSRQLELVTTREERVLHECESNTSQLAAAAAALASRDKLLHDMQLKSRLADTQSSELLISSNNELIVLRSKLQEANSSMKDYRRREEQHVNQIRDSEAQRCQLQQLLNETTASLDKLRESHTKTLDAVRSEHEKSKLALQQALQSEKARMESQIAGLQASSAERILNLEAALTVARTSIEGLATQRAQEIAAAEDLFSAELAAAHMTDTPRARPVKDTLLLMELEVESLKLRLQHTEDQITVRNEECNKVQHQLRLSEDKCTRLVAEMAEYASKPFLHTSTQTGEDIQFTGLQEMCATLRQTVAAADKRSEEIRQKNAELLSQLEHVSQDLRAQRMETAAQREEHGRSTQALTQEIDSAKVSNASLSNRIVDLQQDNDHVTKAGADLKARLEGVQQELSRKHRDLASCMRERKAEQSLADELRATVARLTDQLVASDEQRDNYHKETLSLKTQNSASKDTIYALQLRLAEISEIASKATAFASDLNLARIQLGAAQRESQTLQVDLEKCLQRIAHLESAATPCPTADAGCQADISPDARNIINCFTTQIVKETHIQPVLDGPDLQPSVDGRASIYQPTDVIAPCYNEGIGSGANCQPKPDTLANLETAGLEGNAVQSKVTSDDDGDRVLRSRVLRKMLVHSSGQIEFQYGNKTPTKPELMEHPAADARRLYERLLGPSVGREPMIMDSRSRFDLHSQTRNSTVTADVREYIADIGNQLRAPAGGTAARVSHRSEHPRYASSDSSRGRVEGKWLHAPLSKHQPAPVGETWTELQAAPDDIAHRALSRTR